MRIAYGQKKDLLVIRDKNTKEDIKIPFDIFQLEQMTYQTLGDRNFIDTLFDRISNIIKDKLNCE